MHDGPSKLRLLQSYGVLWIHAIDAICKIGLTLVQTNFVGTQYFVRERDFQVPERQKNLIGLNGLHV